MSEAKDRVALGNRLKEAREYRGFSQEEVSEYLKLPRSAISLIESGDRKLDILELKKLAKLYQCSIDELSGAAKPKEEPEAIRMVARTAAELSKEDLDEVLRFAQFLQSRKTEK